MAFNKKYFNGNIGVGSDAPTVFTVTVQDDEATYGANGYFNAVQDELEVGDLLMIYSEPTQYHGWEFVNATHPEVKTTKIIGA